MTIASIPRRLPADDTLTVGAVAVLGAISASVLHEGLGQAVVAIATGASSGLLTAVAWSSEYDTRLVAAGGTLVNLGAGLLFWLTLRSAKSASQLGRYFLLLATAFNLFDGTGYFFFSGVTDFGDWARVIEGMHPHWLWRLGLVAIGIAAYYGAVVVVGTEFVRDLGIAADSPRLLRLTLLPYLSAIAIIAAAGLLNPIGIRLVWQSALPATAGAYSGLLWFRYYVPKAIVPARISDAFSRNYFWVSAAALSALIFILVLGRGVTISR